LLHGKCNRLRSTLADMTPRRADRPVTIHTLAERAGVHPSTVSRALRRDPAGAPAAVRRIHALAEELGYRPTLAGASLRTGQTHAVGVLVHRLTDVVQAMTFEAIDRAALEAGYQAMVATTHDDPERQRRRADLLLSRGVDGLIVADAHRDGGYVDWLVGRGVAVVLVIRGLPDHVSVTVDDRLAGRLVGSHLADLGHRTVAVLAGLSWSSASTDRAAGAVDALRARGIGPDEDLVVPCGLDVGSGHDAMAGLLDRRPGVTAVFAVNDFTALGAMIALRERGLEPGRDVAVVGYNDVDIAPAAELSTVRSPHDQLGSIALRLLLDLAQGRTAHSIRLSPELVVRASSGGPRAP
jgi:LacI family transcriptional regulator